MTGSLSLSPIGSGERSTIVYPRLPLAVYREIAAHLEQVAGVRITLIPASFDRFDYLASQIGGLTIDYTGDFKEDDRALVRAILDYYARIHGDYRLA